MSEIVLRVSEEELKLIITGLNNGADEAMSSDSAQEFDDLRDKLLAQHGAPR